MKILLLSTEEFSGAGKATCKVKNALKEVNLNCDHRVLLKDINNKNLKEIIKKFFYRIAQKINTLICFCFGKNIKEFQSLSLFPSNLSKEINNSDYDIVHLTWINELLSIEDIGKIKKPIVWTLCDMWPIAGVSHYDNNSNDAFWKIENFNNVNFNKNYLDNWIIQRKIRSWKNEITFVCPSQWLMNCTKESIITNNLSLKKIESKKIPWPIDVKIFNKKNKKELRKKFNFSTEKNIIIFNSYSGIYSKRKGGDLFIEALSKLDLDCELVVIGNTSDDTINAKIDKKIHWMGKINNDLKLAELINCADLIVIPSRMDNLPQTGLEAQACGVPVVAFNTNGIKDLVNHKIDGYLSKPFEIDSLIDGIEWTLNQLKLSNRLTELNLEKTKKNWASQIVGGNYKNLYQNILEKNI